MKETPILFQPWKVRKILDWDWSAHNMQTRRICRMSSVPGFDTHDMWNSAQQAKDGSWIFWSTASAPPFTPYEKGGFVCPYGQAGDRLWVREALSVEIGATQSEIECGAFTYKADDQDGLFTKEYGYRTISPIHIFKWQARIWLEIVKSYPQRVQDISEQDAILEAIEPAIVGSDLDGLKYRASYQTVWNTINAKRNGGEYAWEHNPWVWVVEFKRIWRST